MANIVRYVVDQSLLSGVITCDICRYLDISTIIAIDEEYSKNDLSTFWDEIKRLYNPHKYYVDLSQKLWDLKQQLLNNR